MKTVCINFDSLVVGLAVVACHSAAAQTVETFQAEDAATLSGVTAESGPATGFSGSGYADYGGIGSFVEWTDISAAVDGDYEISIRYAAVNQRPVDVYVDGTKAETFDVVTAGSTWNEWTEESVTVSLAQGGHTIKLVASNGDGPNIDWMSVGGPPPSISRSTVLEPDQSMERGEFRSSPGGIFKVGLEEDGQLVVQDSLSGTSLWTSGVTDGHNLYMQIDGNLVVRDVLQTVVWSSNTFGPGARLAIDDQGTASILLGDNALWTAIQAATALTQQQSLGKGEFRPSPSGKFKIGLDGNSGELVIVDTTINTNVWGCGSTGGNLLVLQADGNLVVKDGINNYIWSTDTHRHAGARLTLEDSGEAAIMHGTFKVWSTVDTSKKPILNPNFQKFGEKVVLNPLEILTKGTWVYSPSSSYKIGFSSEGDLLFQDSGDQIIWRANVKDGVDAFQQIDGNLVVRNANGGLLWTTHTSDNEGSRLVIDDGGRLSVMRGQTVIWVQGIPRGTYTGPSSPDLQYPLRGIFYYSWYPETWTVNGKQAKFIPDIGMYSSDDPTVIEEHIDALEYAYVDLAISSWWGQGESQDLSRMNLLMDKTIELNSQIKWTVYYEDEFAENPSIETIRDDLLYLKNWKAWHPTWAHIDEKPVIFIYNEAGCDVAKRWMEAAEGEWYVVMKLFPGFRDCSVQPNHWHQYGPSSEYLHVLGESVSVSPGFWRADKDTPDLARVSKARFCENVQNMVASGEDWQLVTTFNEAGEGTMVEASSSNWGSETKYGYYLDCLHQHF